MNENAASSVAPSAMNTVRRPSAIVIPIVSALGCCSAGTEKALMMIRNTNRLSTERLFSTTYPAKYCVPRSQPATSPNTTPNNIATAM